MSDVPRALSRNETHDLSMIIKDRTKVLKAHVEEQGATCLADFEKNIGAIYSFDQDEVWEAAATEASRVVEESQKKSAERCEALGTPKNFAPSLEISWRGRGENMIAARRNELRKVAESAVEAMKRAAVTKIEKQGLALRTQVVAMGLLSSEAKLFLESLAPVEESMQALNFAEIELMLERQQKKRLVDPRSYYE